jgi:YHS domain-containing protein
MEKHMMTAKFTAILATALFAAFANADEPTTKPSGAYPLSVCVISGKALPDEGVVTRSFDGREVKLCCEKCIAAFEKDPQEAHKKMDEKIIEASKGAYPLKECIVSGEPLGSMGKPIMYVRRPTNQLVQFCCSSCIKQFEKDPAPYLGKLDKPTK